MMRQYQLVERVKRYNPVTDEGLLNRFYNQKGTGGWNGTSATG